jgi:hypothetical protein
MTTTTPARGIVHAEKAQVRVRQRGEACVTVTRSVIRLNGVRVTNAEMRVLRDIAARIKGEK